MNTYEIRTVTTMKPYNSKKWWIDSNIIPTIEVEAETPKEAHNQWCKIVSEKHYVDISKSAMNKPGIMYHDTTDGPKQCGYVTTGKTEFQKENYSWSTQYIDLWAEFRIIGEAF